MRNLAVAERLGERQALDRSYCCFYHKRTHARTGRYFVCSCCCRRSIARAICSCSSAIFVKPCSRKRFALARCHFADFSSPGFSGSSSVDIGCPLEGWRRSLRAEWEWNCPAMSWRGTQSRACVSLQQVVPLKLAPWRARQAATWMHQAGRTSRRVFC